MANERKTAPLTLFYDGTVVVVDGFPADKFDELMLFAETLTQPAIVPNMTPQQSASSSTQITREPTIIDRFKEQTTIGSNRRGSLLQFFRRRNDRDTPKPPE